MILTLDTISEDEVDETVIDNPEFTDLKAALSRLDGKTVPQAQLTSSKGSYVRVMGPHNSLFVVDLTEGDRYRYVVDPMGSRELATIFVGFDEDEVERRSLVSFDVALAVLEHFRLHASGLPEISWFTP